MAEGNYNYTFSGADIKVFACFPQAPQNVVQLDTVHTISVSIHESKGQVRSLGYRGIKGMARGIKTIAGSIILTAINDHPLRKIYELYRQVIQNTNLRTPFGWSVDYNEIGVGMYGPPFYELSNRIPTSLPPFDLIIQALPEMTPYKVITGESGENFYQAEGIGERIIGIEILDEGHTFSVNDMVTEFTMSYIAKDIRPLANISFLVQNQVEEVVDPVAQAANEMNANHFELIKACFGEPL